MIIAFFATYSSTVGVHIEDSKTLPTRTLHRSPRLTRRTPNLQPHRTPRKNPNRTSLPKTCHKLPRKAGFNPQRKRRKRNTLQSHTPRRTRHKILFGAKRRSKLHLNEIEASWWTGRDLNPRLPRCEHWYFRE